MEYAPELRAIVARYPLVAAVKSLLAARYGDDDWALELRYREGEARLDLVTELRQGREVGEDVRAWADDVARFVETTEGAQKVALARTVGWVAQWNEMISDPDQKIGRPRQLYTGPVQRDYVPVDQR